MGDKGLPDASMSYSMNNLSTMTISGEQQVHSRVEPYVNLQEQQQNLPGGSESNSLLRNNWREEKHSIRQKWEYALEHGLYTDLVFYIGRRREAIKTHSLIFNLQSRKFAEKYPMGDCKTEFDWIEPEPFQHFLKYLYTETINVGIEDALWILIISNYFEVGKLIRICEEKIVKDINVGNAAFVYQKAHDYECAKLEQHAKAFIINHAAPVFETEGILQLTSDSIGAVLESPTKKINEVQAFQAILRWAKAQYCREHYGDLDETMGIQMQMAEPGWASEHVTNDLRHILRTIIGHIDFKKFSNVEFAVYVVPSKILSYEETTMILTELTLRKDGPQRPAALSGAPVVAPSATALLSNVSSDACTLTRYRGPIVDEFWREESGTDRISFKVNKPITILGVGLYGSSEVVGNETPEKVQVSITTYDESTKVGDSKCELVFPKPAGIFEFRFEQPVQIAAGDWHTIHVTMGQVKPYGTSGTKKYEVEVGNGKVVWEFMNAKGIAGFSLGRGQIPQIFFSA